MYKGLATIAVISSLSGLVAATAAPKPAPATIHGSKAAAAVCPMTAQQKTRLVLRQLHAFNTVEIANGRLAEQRGESGDVKSFGSKMVKEHADLERSLATIAEKDGFDLAEATLADPIHAALARADEMRAQQLASVQGRAFDMTYLAPQAFEHEIAISIVEEGQKHAQGDAKRALDHAHDVLNDHLNLARSLVQRMSLQGLGVGGGPESRPPK